MGYITHSNLYSITAQVCALVASVMTGNRFVLSSIACGVSFGITLGLTRGEFGSAFGNGMLTFLASQIGAVVAQRTAMGEDDRQWRAEELRGHIRALQKRRTVTFEELTQLTQERDRAAVALRSLQSQLQQLQDKSNQLWQQKEALSWNLAAPTARRTTAEIQGSEGRLKQLEREEAELNRSLSATLSAKQRAELHLTTTQAELNQLQSQVAEQKARKSELLNDITALTDQQQQLQQTIDQLQAQVLELDRYRTEMNHLVAAAEPHRQQMTQGSTSLNYAISQLQTQIQSLHDELETLETQILDRRTQKDELDQAIETMRDQQHRTTTSEMTPARLQTSLLSPTTFNHRLATVSDPWQEESVTAAVGTAGGGTAIADPAATLPLDFQHYPGIVPPWSDFASQLPQYEFQALSAIAHQANPASHLKQIAEANLTMPELLIDAINERALETIGDIILEPGSTQGIPIIAQEYESSVRAILRVYETESLER